MENNNQVIASLKIDAGEVKDALKLSKPEQQANITKQNMVYDRTEVKENGQAEHVYSTHDNKSSERFKVTPERLKIITEMAKIDKAEKSLESPVIASLKIDAGEVKDALKLSKPEQQANITKQNMVYDRTEVKENGQANHVYSTHDKMESERFKVTPDRLKIITEMAKIENSEKKVEDKSFGEKLDKLKGYASDIDRGVKSLTQKELIPVTVKERNVIEKKLENNVKEFSKLHKDAMRSVKPEAVKALTEMKRTVTKQVTKTLGKGL